MKKITLLILFISSAVFSQTEQTLNYAWAFPTKVNNKIVFVRTEPNFGTELWVSDGTEAGTTILMDIIPGNASSNPFNLTAIDNVIYFTVNDHQIWRTDGTTVGTYNMITNPNITNVGGFIKANNFIFFHEGTTGSSGIRNIWRMQTTPNSAVEVLQATNQSFQNVDRGFYNLDDDNLLINVRTLAHGWSIWRTNGLVSELVKDLNPNNVSDRVQMSSAKKIDNTIYFSGFTTEYGHEPFTTNGTTPETILLKDIFVSNNYFDTSGATNFYKVGNIIYFTAKDNTNGLELWKTNGTAAGTEMIKDITPGNNSNSWSPNSFIEFNNQLYFSKNDEINGSQIWKSDGTNDGTVMVTSNPQTTFYGNQLIKYNNLLFYSAYNQTNGVELWMLDSDDNATLVQDITPGNEGSDPGDFIELNGYLYFMASTNGNATGRKIFRLNSQTLETNSSKNNTISVYPNPANGIFHIENTVENQLEYTVYDQNGKKINHSQNGDSIDITNQASGIYFLKIFNATQNIVSIKKIIKH
ncbi:T9SS type A sorting domain-containing protein [Flavobacterium macrobrachii]|uniref:T9SS type A sorting domain-containing protein n=1 Tax=Flavobacterium macrobrachii TaxID=591204 RepID=A0ABS2D030_9FLAO|nr:T9SS type A sorting domain-containing protein [Flavobacterium macrobrachii]MBM6500536.1 T9SS type A sorting domain-containing protein [Flavobacterium macrobrachii]